MTLQELKDNNPDIILEPIEWEELASIANGQALFYASVAPSQRCIMDRKIRAAGQVMTAGMLAGQDAIYIVRITTYGNVKADIVNKAELGTRVALFRTAPIPAHDHRNMEPYTHW